MTWYLPAADGSIQAYGPEPFPKAIETDRDIVTGPDGHFYFADELPLETVRTAKLAEINAGYETVMAYVQAGYPLQEVLSWERQASQARELHANPDAEALFVRALAAVKGVDVAEMARRILANAENWEPVAAMLTAQRQLMEEAAWAAQSIDDVQAVKVGYSV